MGALNKSQDDPDGSKDDEKLNDTFDKIEKEVIDKDMSAIVEEVITREKYKLSIESIFKRYFTCFDNEYDELVKKMKERKVRDRKERIRRERAAGKVMNTNKKARST